MEVIIFSSNFSYFAEVETHRHIGCGNSPLHVRREKALDDCG